MDGQDIINLVVGGLHFCLSAEDIRSFPNSYFAHLLKDEWNIDKSKVVNLDRDGNVFRFIHYYLLTGFMDTGKRRVPDLKTLIALKKEADFFNLPNLIWRCNSRIADLNEDFCYQTLPNVAPFELYDCVTENEAIPTDPLVSALCPLQQPYVATARLSTYNDDARDTSTPAQPTGLASTSGHIGTTARGLPTGTPAKDFLSNTTMTTLKNSLCVKWPLTPKIIFGADDANVYEIRKGTSYQNISQVRSVHKLGTILYIFNAPFTGGVISASVNGHTVSISQPGECMALQPGVTFNIDTVTSGTLILVEMAVEVKSGYYWPSLRANEDIVPWVMHLPERCTLVDNHIPPALSHNIVSSVSNSLDEYKAVVLCLNHYYKICVSDDPNRRCETNPDTLRTKHAALYAMLDEHFDVYVVSVYICRAVDRIVNACVVDYILDDEITNDTNNGECAKSIKSVYVSEKIKIVSPLYGNGEKFSRRVSQIRDGSDQSAEEDAVSTLLTGLLVTKKHTEA